MADNTPAVVEWHPQKGPQQALIDCHLAEVFFGGARGGGKTSGCLGLFAIRDQQYGPNFNAMMFRRTTVSAEDAIEESKKIYGPLGGQFNGTHLVWRMPNGGRVGFGYLERVQDGDEWQGRNLTHAWIEEAGQYPSSAPIDRIHGVLRSAHGVRTQLIVTANPGGAGQHWLRQRYQLYPFPKQPMRIIRELPNGEKFTVGVIPSRITDNRILLDADPDYINRLYQVGSEELVRAWLDGDWSAVEGAFFDCWNPELHVCEPFRIPGDWLRFRSLDWGSASPFSVGWWAVAGDNYDIGDRVLPRGCLVRYREWYGAENGKGLKLTAEEVADGIRERSLGESYAYGVCDPSAFRVDGGPSIAERLFNRGVVFRPADNRRVPRQGALSGWDQLRQRMKHRMIVCFDTCKDSIRTIPVLQHDPNRGEDVDTKSEDHCGDEWRYACMSRPWVAAHKPIEHSVLSPTGKRVRLGQAPKGHFKMTWDELYPLVPIKRSVRIR